MNTISVTTALLALTLLVANPAAGQGPAVDGNTVTPPGGSSRCRLSRSGENARIDINCIRGSPSFAPGTILGFSSGAGTCTYDAADRGDPVIACTGIPPVASRPARANGATITPPPGSASCEASRRQSGGPFTVTCTPGSPSFAARTRLQFDGSSGRCSYTADPRGQPRMACVGIPRVNSPPGAVDPAIDGNRITPAEGSSSCEASRSGRDQPFTVKCRAGSPSFIRGTTFNFSPSSGRCTYDADSSGRPLVACVGIPPVAPSPGRSSRRSTGRSNPRSPPPSTPSPPAGSDPIIENNSVTPPLGTSSCEVSRNRKRQSLTANCTPGTPSFAPGTTFKFMKKTVAGRCIFEANSRGKAVRACMKT